MVWKFDSSIGIIYGNQLETSLSISFTNHPQWIVIHPSIHFSKQSIIWITCCYI